MLDDLRQEKTEQPLDPLSEGTSLPWSKKVALLCLAVALIGLFIFFTSDSWSSDTKHSKHMKKGEIAHEIESIKARLTDLEMKSQSQPTFSTTAPISEAAAPTVEPSTAAPINLQSLIEQELQESRVQAPAKESEQAVVTQQEEPVSSTAKKKSVSQSTAKKHQTYTVQKGDSLSKISHKFYGSTKFWKRIVEANKDKLGRSQTLRPGMVLVIPAKDEEK